MMVSLLTVVLNACDPGIGVILSNKSLTDKKIEAHYPANFKFKIRDSLTTYRNSVPDSVSWKQFAAPVLFKDTIQRVYSFILKTGDDALVETQWMTSIPTYGQFFIIDNKDTVELKSHSKEFKKRPKFFLGGLWTYTIKN